MASVNIQIQGLDKLRAGMKIAPKVINREVNDGIATSLVILERTAKKETPVDTGRLRASHRQKQSRTQMRGELFPTTDYALFVHERGVTRNWAGNPWLERTANQEQRAVERAIQKAVNMALKKVFR